jgi:hypothetical protein
MRKIILLLSIISIVGCTKTANTTSSGSSTPQTTNGQPVKITADVYFHNPVISNDSCMYQIELPKIPTNTSVPFSSTTGILKISHIEWTGSIVKRTPAFLYTSQFAAYTTVDSMKYFVYINNSLFYSKTDINPQGLMVFIFSY